MEITIEQAIRQGVAAHKEGKLQKAETLYRAILQTQPEHADANHNLGIIAVSCGNYRESLPLFKKAIKANPTNNQYWLSLIDSLIKVGEIFTARDVLVQAKKSGLQGDRIDSIALQLNPSSKLEFFYRYLDEIGIFKSMQGELVNGDSEVIPLLTSTFIDWFQTLDWTSKNLLEFGAGSSTIFFSKFFKSVTSYETNQNWFDKLIAQHPSNVTLLKVDTIIESLNRDSVENLHDFDVVLIDASENRAKLTRWLVKKNYKGIIFFDNSEWYRNSIGIFMDQGHVEIPFFGLKPTEDWVSCTSVLADPLKLKTISKKNWISLPKLAWDRNNSWDDEHS